MGDVSESDPDPWDSQPFPGWVDEVDGWPWKAIDADSWEKKGLCLRCKHEMTVPKGGAVAELLSEDEATEALLENEDAGPFLIRLGNGRSFYARCNCSEPHPGRPPTLEHGCGQAGTIEPPPDE